MAESGDDRSPISKALAIASQITTIGLTMVLPALLGYFVDRWAGTVVLFVILGMAFGVASAVLQLARLVAELNQVHRPWESSEGPVAGDPPRDTASPELGGVQTAPEQVQDSDDGDSSERDR